MTSARTRTLVVAGALVAVITGVTAIPNALAVRPKKGDWLASVEYSTPTPPFPPPTRFSMDVVGGKQKRKVTNFAGSGRYCGGELIVGPGGPAQRPVQGPQQQVQHQAGPRQRRAWQRDR